MIAKELLDKVNEVAASRWKPTTVNRPVIEIEYGDYVCKTDILIKKSDFNITRHIDLLGQIDQWVKYDRHGNKYANVRDVDRHMILALTENAFVFDRSINIIKFTCKNNVIAIGNDGLSNLYEISNLQAILSEYVQMGIIYSTNDKLQDYIDES